MTHRGIVWLWVALVCRGWCRGWTCDAVVNERQDCGWVGMSQLECAGRECCWDPSDRTPWCYRPIRRCPYVAFGGTIGGTGEYVLEKRCIGRRDVDMHAIPKLKLEIHYLRYGVVNIIIKPIDAIDTTQISQYYPKRRPSRKQRVNVLVDTDPFALQIWRRSDGHLLFDMLDMVYQEYYVSMTTNINPNGTLHGLGYRAGPLTLPYGRYAIFSRDASTIESNGNLYSPQPMYMNVVDGRAHGVFFMNTHPMEADYKRGTVQMRLLGGSVDMFVFPGPTIGKVHKQYLSVIGTPPAVDPRFFGLQQSRYGYKTVGDVEHMVEEYRRHKLPLDVVWLDIEYSYTCNDFEVDEERYPRNRTTRFIERLHQQEMAVVPIVDPAIKIDSRLRAYRLGLQYNVFLTHDGQPYRGRVWPGPVHFLDFSHPNATTYMRDMLAHYQKTIHFDGLWLDMNEPSNFDSGPVFKPAPGYYSLNYPKYDINNGDRMLPLHHQTVPMDVECGGGKVTMYQVHNVYGMTEAILVRNLFDMVASCTNCTTSSTTTNSTNSGTISQKGQKSRNPQRAFLLTRSVFPGSAQYTASWLGDNQSTFAQLRESIWGVLKYNLFSGMAMTGPDLCGFGGTADDELCARWMAVGAFFPFSRNHNSADSAVDQEPYRFPWTAVVTRKYYGWWKYSLLPYWITLFERHRRFGAMVMAPYGLDDGSTQFVVGEGVMVCPVTERGERAVACRFGGDRWHDLHTRWYDLHTDTMIDGNETQVIPAPLDHLPVFVRSGTILFRHDPKLTVMATLRTDYAMHIYVGVGEEKRASGYLYVDDHKTAHVGDDHVYLQVAASVRKRGLVVEWSGHFGRVTGKRVTALYVHGLQSKVLLRTSLSIDGPLNVTFAL